MEGGSREVSGDGLLLVGSAGAVLQVKSREATTRDTDVDTRTRGWIEKRARKAREQGCGTKRELERLQRAGTPLTVTPVRVLHLPTEESARYRRVINDDPSHWPVVVILDHPNATGIDLDFESGVMWITFDDWLWLHRQLRSTAGLLRYVRRVLDARVHVPLGHERERYAQAFVADALASGGSNSLPELQPPDGGDELGADLFHDVIDKVWPADGSTPWCEPDDYRAIVEFLDGVPPSGQAALGRAFLKKRRELSAKDTRVDGIAQLDRRDRLVFAFDAHHRWSTERSWLDEVAQLTVVRHQEAMDSGAPGRSTTLGVGCLVKDGDVREVMYVFALVRGRIELSAAIRRRIESGYGVFTHGRTQMRKLKVGRNDPCPCGGQTKYKSCHGR